ncbi:hypothetical protein BS47DRAFT_1370808 [Hydnum rufescens UP504]|uniref:Thioredoxin peroxidase n=1 Tax=Hydnum rufescens UP504 TaxID=1448309 RepID=A0A9P6B7I0_9AGAM|nr:hypothetical protein BS47DRAFT_1370808 [Hydnum rufescens UP504]
MAESPRLRLGSIAPDFEAQTTKGTIKFHEWLEVARRHADFQKRGVKVIGLSANGLESHEKWIADINDFDIADADRKISHLYDMLDAVDITNVDAKGQPFTVRTVFVIDPKKIIRLTVSYPAQVGRSFDEILRVVDSLQLGDKHKVTTPVNWKNGEDQANTLFPGYVKHLPYLRTTTAPA